MRTPLIVLAASALVAGTTGAQRLTIDQLIQIKHPSAPQWTSDGSHIWFTYDSGGVNNLWAVPADGSGRAVALTAAATRSPGAMRWSPTRASAPIDVGSPTGDGNGSGCADSAACGRTMSVTIGV